ncbi:MAG: FecR domain-containing protein [Stellaceae bacterium]
MHRRSFPAWCVAAAVLFWATGASADDQLIGTVIAVRGEVFRQAGPDRQALTSRQPVHLADTIIAGGGKAKILLNDGSIVSIGENSRLALAQYQSVGNRLTTRLHLFEGVLRLFVNRSTAGGRFEIESETAVAAVRGTDWLIEAVPDRTGVAIIQGVVAVSGLGPHQQATVLLEKPGDGVDVRRGEPPGAVHPWSRERFDTLSAHASFD